MSASSSSTTVPSAVNSDSVVISSSSNKSDVNESVAIPSENVQLEKRIGLFNAIGIIVGIIVGSGIFITPTGVLAKVGSVGGSLVVWTACGLLSTIGALCYAELGTSIPKSGGDFAYIKEAFGPLPAFLFLWVALLIIIPAGNAVAALTLATYMVKPFYPGSDCEPPDDSLRLVAALAITLLTFINCYSVRWATFVQDSFTSAKTIALAIIIGVGLYHLTASETSAINRQNFSNPWEGTNLNPGIIAASFYSGLFSFAGWNYLNFIVEEVRDPYKNLPRAIYISLPMVTIIYVLANVAYFAVLNREQMLLSPAVAVTFGDKVLGVMSWIMPVSVAMSSFGGLNGCILTSSRLFFVGSRAGLLPEFLSFVNIHYFTPIPALLILGILSLLYLAITQISVLIDYVAFVESVFITLSIAALLYLRWKQPDMKRPIKVNLILPILFFFICLFLVVLPFLEDPVSNGVGVVITLIGIPIYYLSTKCQSKSDFYQKASQSFTIFLQKFFLCVISEDESDK